MAEQGAQGQFRPQSPVDAADHLGGFQAMAAPFEEIVMDAHGVRVQAQHLDPDGRQGLFHRGGGGGVIGLSALIVGRGQGLPVHLAAGGQGQGRE